MDYITQNWEAILGVITASVVLLDKIAKLTPTNVDNDIVDFFKRKFGKKEEA